MNDTDDLTPTEFLITEVLVARWRLGESLWTFPTVFRPAMRKLEARGLVGWKSGIAPGTIMAWLSKEGIDQCTYPGYSPPS